MGAYACWCSGGLETQLFTFLVTLGFDLVLAEVTMGKGCASAAAFAFAAMTRPEGAMFFALASLFRLLTNLRRERRLLPRKFELVWLGLFLALFVPYFAWRWHYYGWPFPNTFYVKSSGASGTWKLGAYYCGDSARTTGCTFCSCSLCSAGRRATMTVAAMCAFSPPWCGCLRRLRGESGR